LISALWAPSGAVVNPDAALCHLYAANSGAARLVKHVGGPNLALEGDYALGMVDAKHAAVSGRPSGSAEALPIRLFTNVSDATGIRPETSQIICPPLSALLPWKLVFGRIDAHLTALDQHADAQPRHPEIERPEDLISVFEVPSAAYDDLHSKNPRLIADFRRIGT